jgi:hypothetical protein
LFKTLYGANTEVEEDEKDNTADTVEDENTRKS